VNRILSALVLVGLMALARWVPIAELTSLGDQATVSLGFILVFGFLTGHFVKPLGMPGITGYILAGILCGPFVARLLTTSVVEELQLIDDLALALIAFTAGGELKIKTLRPRLASILAINASQTLLLMLGLGGGAVLLQLVFPFVPTVPLVSLALVFGVLGVANSPATAVAVIQESRAKGPLTDTVLGVTVLKDVVILILISLLIPLLETIVHPGLELDVHFMGELLTAVGGSLVGGVILGALVTLYIRGVGAVLPLFIVGVAILVTQASRQLHLEPLLLCMVAGFVIENATRQGDRFIQAIERSALPVYVVFFAIGGASLDLSAVRETGVVALVLVSLRLVLLLGSTRLAEAFTGKNVAVARWGWMGFVAQAGVTLGLASIIARRFPDWGGEVRSIALAMIALNQLLGPVAFRWALVRSGEAGRAGETAVRRN
jgi:Kef-type K+ transport system membrane component KefB